MWKTQAKYNKGELEAKFEFDQDKDVRPTYVDKDHITIGGRQENANFCSEKLWFVIKGLK